MEWRGMYIMSSCHAKNKQKEAFAGCMAVCHTIMPCTKSNNAYIGRCQTDRYSSTVTHAHTFCGNEKPRTRWNKNTAPEKTQPKATRHKKYVCTANLSLHLERPQARESSTRRSAERVKDRVRAPLVLSSVHEDPVKDETKSGRK